MTDISEFLNEESKRRSKSSESDNKSIDDNIIYPSSLPPELSLNISSEHTLQLTLTKTSLEILMELQKVTTHSVTSSAITYCVVYSLI